MTKASAAGEEDTPGGGGGEGQCQSDPVEAQQVAAVENADPARDEVEIAFERGHSVASFCAMVIGRAKSSGAAGRS